MESFDTPAQTRERDGLVPHCVFFCKAKLDDVPERVAGRSIALTGVLDRWQALPLGRELGAKAGESGAFVAIFGRRGPAGALDGGHERANSRATGRHGLGARGKPHLKDDL